MAEVRESTAKSIPVFSANPYEEEHFAQHLRQLIERLAAGELDNHREDLTPAHVIM